VQSQSDSGKGEKGDPGLPGIGFYFTDDGNFDFDGKRLTDVANPTDNEDAPTKNYVDTKNFQQDIAVNSKAEKSYVDTKNTGQDIAINSKAEKNYIILRDGCKSMNANLDMKYNINDKKSKIINLANGTSDGEAVNFAQLKSHTVSHGNNYHLQTSFTFDIDFGDKTQLTISNTPPAFQPRDHFFFINMYIKISIL